MRAPDEIMLGLECCLSMNMNCRHCPYRATPSTARDRAMGKCREFLGGDAQELIKQMDAERGELMNEIEDLRDDNADLSAIFDDLEGERA